MKQKTARRRLRRNEWKMARAKIFGSLAIYRGLGKKWKNWTRVALSESIKLPVDKAKATSHSVNAMIRKMMEIRSPKAVEVQDDN
jgi:hypothetical protein